MNFISTSYRWFAVYTRSRFEKKLASNLTNQGIECYLPLKTERKHWSDRIKTVEEPLLNGYLFVKISNREYYEVLNTAGAVCYVSFEGKPAAIPERQIDNLRLFMDHFNEEVNAVRGNIARGQKVIVVSGPLKGVTGELHEFRGKNRIGIRFEKLGYCVLTDIAIDNVELFRPDLLISHREMVEAVSSQ